MAITAHSAVLVDMKFAPRRLQRNQRIFPLSTTKRLPASKWQVVTESSVNNKVGRKQFHCCQYIQDFNQASAMFPHSMWVRVVEALLINLHSCWMYNQDAMRPIRLLFRRVLNSRPRIRHWCDMRPRAEWSNLLKTDEDEEMRFKQLSRQDPSFGWR